jgi:hypothetical protein
VTLSAISGVTANTFQYTAGASAISSASGSLDHVEAVLTRYYIVGDQSLEVYLNGELMRRGDDYTEVGVPGAQSNQITWTITIVLDDAVSYRIDSNGGQVVILSGGSGSLQAAYNAGNSLTTLTGVPFTINGPAAEKIFVVNGDITVTGIIDPTALQFTPQASNPLGGGDHGLWVSTAGELMYARAGDPEQNITAALAGGLTTGSVVDSARLVNNTAGTLSKGTPVSINSLGDLQEIDVAVEANALAIVGMVASNISIGQSGDICTHGRLENITTGANYGDVLYVSKTGGLTNIKPSIGVAGFVVGDYAIALGTVVDDGGGGKSILIRVQVIGQL